MAKRKSSGAVVAEHKCKSRSIHQPVERWRVVIVGDKTIDLLRRGETVEIASLHVSLVPADELWNNRAKYKKMVKR